MGTKKRHIRTKHVSLAHQLSDLQSSGTGFRGSVHRDVLTAEGKVSPTPVSRTYTVNIRLAASGRPVVFITEPSLELEDSRRPPHTFRDGSLCLFYPRYREWTRSRYLSETIVPWTKLWLYYYELWLLFGQWLGGGIHPGSDEG